MTCNHIKIAFVDTEKKTPKGFYFKTYMVCSDCGAIAHPSKSPTFLKEAE
jgi:hypothetical protein